MPSQLLGTAVSFVLILPWWLCAQRAIPDRAPVERFALGAVGGLAASVTLAYLLAMAGWLGEFVWVWSGAAALGVVLHFAVRRSTDPRHASGAPPIFWCALLAIAVAHAIPVFANDAPLGWDPSFHSILARKVLDSGSLARDWLPFEDIGVTYPQGLHVLTAVISRWARVEPHQTLQTLHLVIQGLAALMVGLIGRRVFDGWRPATLAMLVYALLCHWGSFSSYYEWGGFPTQLSLLFFLGLVWAVLTLGPVAAVAFGTLLFGSIVLTHHLSALICTWVLAFYILLHLGDLRRDGLARRFALIFAAAFVAYSFFIVPYLLRVPEVSSGAILNFYGETIVSLILMPGRLGTVASGLGVAGLWMLFRTPPRTETTFLICWFTALLSGFVLLDYVYRVGSVVFFGEEFAAFTPSRWLTVISYPLALCGGFALSRAAAAAARTLERVFGKRADGVVVAAVVVAILAGSMPTVLDLARRRAFRPELLEIASLVREQAPANAFVFYPPNVPNRVWLPYLTWRPTVFTPIPASEDRVALSVKRDFHAADPEPAVLRAWLDERGLEGFVVRRNRDRSLVLSRTP